MVIETATERVAAAEGTGVATVVTGAAAMMGAMAAAAMGTGAAATEAAVVVATGAAATTGVTAAMAAVMMGTGTAVTEAAAVVSGVAGQNRPLCLQDLRLDFFQIAEDLNLNIRSTPSGEVWIK